MEIKPGKNAIVLAMFGTSVEQGLAGLQNICKRVSEKFPKTTVRMVFTSKVLRQIWKERNDDPEYRLSHPDIPIDILKIQNLQEALDELQEKGIQSLVVQPVQIAPETRAGLHKKYMKDVAPTGRKNGKSPFSAIAVGRPLLGTLDTPYPSRKDIEKAARALSEDAALARHENAALLYMGHGNKYPETKKIYNDIVGEMRRVYPDVMTYMSLVEGNISNKDILKELRADNVHKVVLKAFMVVAGNHVRKDMVGEDSGSLHTLLENEGIEVHPVMKGLGENDLFVDIFIQHANDAAQAARIELK